MKFILIGNYLPDKQESMIRFAQMLNNQLSATGHQSQIWFPTALFGLIAKKTNVGIGKWLGYIDKYFIFPLILKKRLASKSFEQTDVFFHICDHSNSPYLKYFPKNKTGITCHDVIAIRGGLGYSDSYQPASTFGKLLQKWILYHLSRVKLLASVSNSTLNQLKELVLVDNNKEKKWTVIHNAFNAEFGPIELNEVNERLKTVGLLPETSFILHVGSALPRKNRKVLLDMVKMLGDNWIGFICFAGDPIDEDLQKYILNLQLKNRIISIVKPNHFTLVALYNACEAFVFPSYSEGFGWPVIEAQACGAPVISSDIEPMPEISGGAALHCNPNKPAEFASAFLKLRNKTFKTELIQAGFKNSERFQPDTMINSYINLYKSGSE